MICPYCKMDIEEDSYFCDQCGQEILMCPNCNKPGKGKMCTHDGTPLVTARIKGGVSTDLSVDQRISYGITPFPTIGAPSILTPATELHLINKNLNLDLKIENDEIIGRTTGRFMDTFSKFSQVSKQHCQIKFDQKQGWVAIDLDSTNGTKYNNIPLKQGQHQPLTDKSFLLIANIEFYIEIRSKDEKDKTTRI
ncbi:MAG: FHA domain-containing protein [bacterium]